MDNLVQLAHQAAHAMPHDPEDTVTIALTARELSHITLGIMLIRRMLPCLEENSQELYGKFAELVEAQKGIGPDEIEDMMREFGL